MRPSTSMQLGLTAIALASWSFLQFVQEEPVLASVAGLSALLVSQALLIYGSRRANPNFDIQRAAREAERGRKLAIYDPSSGLLAQWYFELRLDEEARRTKRYGLPFVVLTLENALTSKMTEREPKIIEAKKCF